MESFFYYIVKITGLIAIQIALGKKGSYPYGIMLGLNLYWVTVIVIITDLSLMIFVDRMIDVTQGHFALPKIVRKRVNRLYKWLLESVWGKRLQQLGKLGTLSLTATPFIGGVWSGIALAHILVLTRRSTLTLITFGTFIGCGIFLFASESIVRML